MRHGKFIRKHRELGKRRKEGGRGEGEEGRKSRVERREETKGDVPWDVAAAFHLNGGRIKRKRDGYLLVYAVASTLSLSLPPSHSPAPPFFLLTLAS